MNVMELGVQLMGYGLLGVFTTLISFIIIIKLLTAIFPYNSGDK